MKTSQWRPAVVYVFIARLKALSDRSAVIEVFWLSYKENNAKMLAAVFHRALLSTRGISKKIVENNMRKSMHNSLREAARRQSDRQTDVIA